MSPLVREYATVTESLDKVLRTMRPGRRSEQVPVREVCGRVLAEDVLAADDVPPIATSHKDGFALGLESIKGASLDTPVAIKVVGSAGPGSRPKSRVGAGEALRVATGAGIPRGADAVLPAESVAVAGGAIAVTHVPEPGSHVYRAGGDFRKGEFLLSRGRVLKPQDLGLLISLRRKAVRVAPRPRISIIPTGSELAPPDGPRRGRVVESHSSVFQSLCGILGCQAVNVGVVEDDPAKLSRALRTSLARSDMVLTLGGTSAGRRDLVVGAVANLRPELLVHGLKLDRGRVAGVASVNGKPVLMLPGPIQAAMNAFLLVGTPLVDAILGRSSSRMEIPCTLAGEWAARPRYSDFLKVVYVKLRAGDSIEAEPVSAESESIKILTDADGYIVVPEPVRRLERGERVRVRLFPGDPRFA